MDWDNPFTDKLNTFAKKISSFIQGTVFRLIVHATSVVVAGVAVRHQVFYQGQLVMGASFSFIFAYIGMVCLVPRGMSLTPGWIIPTGAGIAHILSMVAMGQPWETTFIWAGLQTWLMRLIIKKGQMGWEWLGLPWLLAGTISLLRTPALPALLPLIILLVITVTAIGVFSLAKKLFLTPFYQKRLRIACQGLNALRNNPALPPEMQEASWQLAKQSSALRLFSPLKTEAEQQTVDRIFNTTYKLHRFAQKQNAEPASAVLDFVRQTRVTVENCLESSSAIPIWQREIDFSDMPVEEKSTWLYSVTLDLTKKAKNQPARMRAYLQRIEDSAAKMLEDTAQNPYKQKQCFSFLGKYLPVVHKLVDDYTAMHQRNDAVENAQEILIQSERLAERLATAFETEYVQALQGQTIDIKAELNVLDSMLKMQGK